MRIGELQGLRPKDIDFKNQVISVVGKGRKRRPLTLTGPVAPAWEALLREIENPPAPPGHKPAVRGGYIFPQYESWGQKMMDALCKEAFGEIELVEPDGTKTMIPARPGRPHMLRHTLATMARLHFTPPWDLPYLSKWLGHKDITTTFRIYGHLTVKAPPSGYARTNLEQQKSRRT